MNLFHNHSPHPTDDPGNKHPSSTDNQEEINPYGPELNIADGGEFLDDGIRMKDQPFEEGGMEEGE